MAHRVNVTPVLGKFRLSDKEKREVIVDPVCGAKLPRHEARHVLFRGTDVYYFCSKECQEEFVHPKRPKIAGDEAA